MKMKISSVPDPSFWKQHFVFVQINRKTYKGQSYNSKLCLQHLNKKVIANINSLTLGCNVMIYI